MSIQKDNFFWRFFRRTFGMNPSLPEPPTIYGLFTKLDARYPERQNTYRWKDFMTDREFPNSSLCFVDEVTWHKSHSMDQHEFLRFEIGAPYGPHRAIVVVGRTVVISSVAKLSAVALTSSGCCASSESLAQAAVDEVVTATMGTRQGKELMDNRNCALVSSLTFPKFAPSADELSTLLAVMSQYRETYHLFDSQCFWYAKTAFKALVELFEGREDPGDGDHSGGKIHGSKLSLHGNVHEVCCLYKEEREALAKDPDRLRKIHADTTMQVDPQASQGDADRYRQEAETYRRALEAKESERRQAQLAFEASERQNQQLQLQMQLLRTQLTRAVQKA